MKENSIKEDIERLELCSNNKCNICGRYEKEECMLERNRCERHILSAYQGVLKENEELLELKVSASAHNRILELEKENKELKTRLDEIDKINFPIIN